ncbi:Rdx family protein [Bacillus sp. V3]|nr:Rdx family protein [[Bacillus] enclensis]QTC42697.1 Rdx family protein [Bacillus sp. V3]QWC20890.1 Rdx family protein [Bacillus haikouensis]
MFTHFRYDIPELLLIPSSGGAFEITVGENKIYSKLDTGVFPDVNDIISKIEEMR